MACLFDTTVEKVVPGNRMLVEDIGWCIKLEPEDGVPYNAMVESVWDENYRMYLPNKSGRLIFIPFGTIVATGYGQGRR